MRQDKLTTKFQEALGEAQSLALAHDNQVIEPVHILAAVLADGEGSSRSLLERAGVNVQSLTREVNAASSACRRFRARAATCRSRATS